MKEINLLREMLQQHLQWNAARVTFVFFSAAYLAENVQERHFASGDRGT
jgi:hypothetical protein